MHTGLLSQFSSIGLQLGLPVVQLPVGSSCSTLSASKFCCMLAFRAQRSFAPELRGRRCWQGKPVPAPATCTFAPPTGALPC